MTMLSVNVNINEVVNAFEYMILPKVQRRIMKKVKKEGANIIRLEAYKRAPVWKPKEPHHQPYRTFKGVGKHYGGALKKTLKTKGSGLQVTRRGNVYIVAGGEVNYVPYAHLVEFGHEGPRPAPPHPFLAPAAEAAKDEAKDEAVKVFIAEVGKSLEKARLRRTGR